MFNLLVLSLPITFWPGSLSCYTPFLYWLLHMYNLYLYKFFLYLTTLISNCLIEDYQGSPILHPYPLLWESCGSQIDAQQWDP